MIPFTWHSGKTEATEMENKWMVARGWGLEMGQTTKGLQGRSFRMIEGGWPMTHLSLPKTVLILQLYSLCVRNSSYLQANQCCWWPQMKYPVWYWLDRSTALCLCHNPQNWTLQKVNFTVWKFCSTQLICHGSQGIMQAMNLTVLEVNLIRNWNHISKNEEQLYGVFRFTW